MRILACGNSRLFIPSPYELQAEPSNFLWSVFTPSWIDREGDMSCIYPVLRPGRLLKLRIIILHVPRWGDVSFFRTYFNSNSCLLLNILGCSQDRECKNNLIEEQGESAEGVGEPQPALPCPPVVIDHQRLSVRHFINPLLFSVTLSVLGLNADNATLSVQHRCTVEVS